MPGRDDQRRSRTEPPLRGDELRVLRGMMDEYRYQQSKDTFFRAVGAKSRVAVVTIAAVGMFVLQIVALYFAVRGTHTVTVLNK